jgi:hypothetical protein
MHGLIDFQSCFPHSGHFAGAHWVKRRAQTGPGLESTIFLRVMTTLWPHLHTAWKVSHEIRVCIAAILNACPHAATRRIRDDR